MNVRHTLQASRPPKLSECPEYVERYKRLGTQWSELFATEAAIDRRGEVMGHDITTRMGATMPTWAIEGEETAILSPEEWPKRDAVPFVRGGAINAGQALYDGPFPVTEEMLFAGSEALLDGGASPNEVAKAIYRAMVAAAIVPNIGPSAIGLRPAEVTLNMLNHADALGFDLDGAVYAAIFRAMNAVAPVALVSDAEIALTKERDEWKGAAKLLGACHNDAMKDVLERDGQLASLRAELMAAREDLSVFREEHQTLMDVVGVQEDALAKAPVVPDPPSPIANAIREHETDRRMVGR